MAYNSTPRETLRLVVDMIPENKVWDALIAVEDLLEPNEETLQAIDDVNNRRNLIGPFNSAEEMMKAVLEGEDDDYD
ncbi:MAG: hypothetical protein IJQ56_09350 [Synergistaceae bacterium]|nr:hypothetical protein [Synergistaceae bacterium]